MARPRPNDTPTRSPVNDPGPVATATLVNGRPSRRARDSATARSNVGPDGPVCSPTTLPSGSQQRHRRHRRRGVDDEDHVRSRSAAGAGRRRGSRTLISLRASQVEAVAPFDHHRALVEQLVEAEVGELARRLHAVQVDVRELHPARIDPHQLEGRALRPARRSRCPAPGPRTKVVLPAPSGPASSTRSPGFEPRIPASRPRPPSRPREAVISSRKVVVAARARARSAPSTFTARSLGEHADRLVRPALADDVLGSRRKRARASSPLVSASSSDAPPSATGTSSGPQAAAAARHRRELLHLPHQAVRDVAAAQSQPR